VFSRRPLPESPSGELDVSAPSTRELMRRLLADSPEALSAPETSTVGPSTRGNSSGPTLLLVEDEASVRAIAREMLVASGFRVHEAATGPEALTVAQRATPPIDLLITDLVLPGMSGAELAERLRAARPALRVLFTSGHSDEAIDRLGVSRTDPTFLQKPFTFEAFVGKVRGVLAHPAQPRPGTGGEGTRQAA
jgi:DNA-binding response OmpR family regulator